MAGNDWGSGAFLVGLLATVAFPHFLTSGGVHLKQEAEEKPVMISSVGDYLAGGPVMVGALLAMAVPLGLLRLPDFHTVSKAGTVGSCPELLRLAVHIAELSTALPARAGVVFFMLMAQILADLLAKAAYSAGYRLWQGSLSDDLAETVARDKKNRIVAT